MAARPARFFCLLEAEDFEAGEADGAACDEGEDGGDEEEDDDDDDEDGEEEEVDLCLC